jgi:hypothetical protein
MSEDTTTTTEQEPVQAEETPQPEQPETQAVQAEESNEETADTTNQTDSSDDELMEWAEKKGIKTDDPKVLLKMVKESETKMHSATQEAKALKSTVNTIGEEVGLDDFSLRENRLRVLEFYLTNPDAKSLDEQMAEIVKAKPALADDLETVYELAKARSAATRELEAKKQGQKEALAAVAKAESAKPPQSSATTRESVGEVTDADIAKMTVAEYNQFKKDTGYNPFQ